MWQLWWVSKDRARHELMDEYPDKASAKEAVSECRAALIEQGMTKEEIDSGSWEITKKEK